MTNFADQQINDNRASGLDTFIYHFPFFSDTNSLYWGFHSMQYQCHGLSLL
jgi:hypothetical protein